jgi:hypothetical protein
MRQAPLGRGHRSDQARNRQAEKAVHFGGGGGSVLCRLFAGGLGTLSSRRRFFRQRRALATLASMTLPPVSKIRTRELLMVER